MSHTGSDDNFRYQLVDYLTNTGIYEFVIVGGNPREVPSLKTLRLTFDNVTWVLVIISVITVVLLLFIIDIIWNYLNNYNTSKLTLRKHGHHGMCNVIQLKEQQPYNIEERVFFQHGSLLWAPYFKWGNQTTGFRGDPLRQGASFSLCGCWSALSCHGASGDL